MLAGGVSERGQGGRQLRIAPQLRPFYKHFFFSLVLPQHTRFIQQFLPTITFGNKADERYDLKRKQWGLGTREVGS